MFQRSLISNFPRQTRQISRCYSQIHHKIVPRTIGPMDTLPAGLPGAKTPPTFDFLHGDLVLLHGFAGAELTDETTTNLVWPPQDWTSTLSRLSLSFPSIWEPLAQANNRIDDPQEAVLGQLALPLDFPWDEQGQDEMRKKLSVKSSGFASTFPPYDIARELMNAMQTRENTAKNTFRFHLFHYDFRMDNVYSATKLRRFLHDIAQKSNGAPISIIAHSMGGPVTLASLNLDLGLPELPVKAVLFCGSPFSAVPSIYYFFTKPHPFLPMTAVDALTWRSAYTFLPKTRSGGLVTGMYGLSRREFEVDSWDVERGWIDTGLAIPLLNDFGEERTEEYLEMALATAREFHGLLEKKNQRYPEFVNLVSRQWGTPSRTLVQREGERITRVLRPAEFVEGDGVVTIRSTLMPDAYDYTLVPSWTHHGGLMNDLHGVALGLKIGWGFEVDDRKI